MKTCLHGFRRLLPCTRRRSFLGALAVAGNVFLLGAFHSVEAAPDPRPGERQGGGGPAGREFLPAQDFAPLAGAVREVLPRTIAAPVPFPPEPAEIELPSSFELVEHFHRSATTHSLAGAADSILLLPEAFLDDTLRLVASLFPRPDPLPRPEDPSTGVTAKLFDIQPGPREGRLFTAFLSNWVQREESLLTRVYEADLDTGGVEDLDVHELLQGQGKLLWDALRQTYRSKYRIRSEDRIRDDAFQLGEWRGADFAVLPPLVLGYVWWRGLEKRVSIGDTWLNISVEPLSSWVSGSEDLVAGLSLEWGLKGIPVGLIVSFGRYDGTTELDFVGIGTSIAAVRQALGVRLAY